MAIDNQMTEEKVDEIVLTFIQLHKKDVKFDEKDFLDLLKHSLSLNTMEKKRVVDAMPTLSQFQIDELKKVFIEERQKFRELSKEHPDDIKKLLSKQQKEWIQLGDLYKSEKENKKIENEDQDKIDNIKASLWL